MPTILALLLAFPASASAVARVTMLKRLSRGNPFPASCRPSVEPLPPDSAGEPRLAVSPRDPRRMVAVFGQLPSMVTMATRDGGRSWTRSLPPGLSRCTGGTSDFTGDGYVAMGPGGTAYLTSIPTQLPIPNTTAAPRTWVILNRSSDGGRSWSRPVTVAPNDGSFWDKDAVTPDVKRRGVVYDAFIKSDQSNGSAGYLARGVRQGRRLSPPVQNFPDQQLQFMHDPQILSLPDGALVEVFVLFNNSEELPAAFQFPVTMEAMRSTDGGRHWSSPTRIARAPNAVPYEPDSGQQIDALVWPSAAVGPGGTVYVSWQSNASAHSGAIEISRSVNDGRTWSRPRAVARVAAQAWQPTVSVDAHGTVGVTWYDARHDRPGDGKFTTDVWFASSANQGASWESTHLAGPFDFLRAGRRNGRPFIGDYQGLVPTPQGFAAAFAMAPPASGHAHSAIFFARIGLSR